MKLELKKNKRIKYKRTKNKKTKNKRTKYKRTKYKRTKNKRTKNKRMKGGSRGTGKGFEEELKYAFLNRPANYAFRAEPENYVQLLDYLRGIEDKILILGGGPVGLFAAHYILTYYPDTHVVLAEKRPAYVRNQVINIAPNILRKDRVLFDIPEESEEDRLRRSAAHARMGRYVIHDNILKEFMKYGCKMYRLPWGFRQTSDVPGAEVERYSNRVVQQYRHPDINSEGRALDIASLGQVPLTADQTRCVDPIGHAVQRGENPVNIQDKLVEYRSDTNKLSISLPIDAIQYILTRLLNSDTYSERFNYLELDMIKEKLNKTVPELLRELSNLKFPIVLPALGAGIIDKSKQYLTEDTEVRETARLRRQFDSAPNGVWENEFVKLQREATPPQRLHRHVSMEFINKLDRGVNLWFLSESGVWTLEGHIEPGKSKIRVTFIDDSWRAVPGINVSNLDKIGGMRRIKHFKPHNSSLDMIEWTIEPTENAKQIYTLTDNKIKDLKGDEKRELEALNELSGVFEFTKTLEDIDWAGTTVGPDDYTKPQLIHGYITTVKLKNDSQKSYKSGNMLNEKEISRKLEVFNSSISSLNPIPRFTLDYSPHDPRAGLGNLERLLDSFDNMEDLFGCHAVGPDGQGHAGFCYFIDRFSDNQSYARLFPKNSKLRDKKNLKEVPYHKVFNAPYTGELYLGIVANEKYLEIEDLKIRFIDALSRYGVSPVEISGFYGGSFDGHFPIASGEQVVTGFSIKKHKPNLDRLPILVNDTRIHDCLGEGYLAGVTEINDAHRRDAISNILNTVSGNGSLSGFIGDAFYPAHFFTGSGVGLGCIGAGITIDYLKYCLNQGREQSGATREAQRGQVDTLLSIQAQVNQNLKNGIFDFSHGITDTVSNNFGFNTDTRGVTLRPLLDTRGLDEYITSTRAEINSYIPLRVKFIESQTILLSSFKLIKKTAKELPVYSVKSKPTEGKNLSEIKLIHGGQGRETKENIRIPHFQSRGGTVWYVIRSPSEGGDPVFVCRRYSDFVELNNGIKQIDTGIEFKNKLPWKTGVEINPEFRKKRFEMWLNEIIMVYFQGDYIDMIGEFGNPENLNFTQKNNIRTFVNTFLHERNWQYANPSHFGENAPPDPQSILDGADGGHREAQPRAGGGGTLEESKLKREEERTRRLVEAEEGIRVATRNLYSRPRPPSWVLPPQEDATTGRDRRQKKHDEVV